MNAPYTSQRMMVVLFRGITFVRCYLDDVAVFLPSMEDKTCHLSIVFETIAEHGMKLKVTKCSFVHSKVKLLGHLVDRHGVSVETGKVEAIRTTAASTDMTKLRSLFGLAGYYRRFIQVFDEVSAVLHEAPSLKERFEWIEEIYSFFLDLKEKLT